LSSGGVHIGLICVPLLASGWLTDAGSRRPGANIVINLTAAATRPIPALTGPCSSPSFACDCSAGAAKMPAAAGLFAGREHGQQRRSRPPWAGARARRARPG